MEAAKALAHVLAGAWRDEPPPFTLDETQIDSVTPSLLQSGAAALAYWRLRKTQLANSNIAQTLQEEYYQNAVRTALRADDIQVVVTALEQAGIEPLLFKGWASARLYSNPALRPFTDIDVFVRPENLETAQQVVGNLQLRQLTVDLHTETEDETHATRVGARGLEELYARSERVALNDARVRVLAQEDHLHLLAMHCLRHGAWQPLWLCDIAVSVETLPQEFDWDRCLGRGREADYIACAIGLAHELLDARIQGTPVEERAENLPKWLAATVLQQWENPDPRRHYAPSPIRYVWKNPQLLAEAVRGRWIDPLEATMLLNGPFDDTPRTVYQWRWFMKKGTSFLLRPFRG
jgi:hypothetical protein